MPLSVSTSPADPTLAALSPGGDLSAAANLAGSSTPFVALYPDLASTTGTPAPNAAPVVAPPSSEIVPPWIGSTLPSAPAQSRFVSLPANPAASPASTAPALPGEVLPASVVVDAVDTPSVVIAKPAGPSLGRPAVRGARREAATPPLAANPLSADLALALSLTPGVQPPAPIAIALTETSLTPPPAAPDAGALVATTPGEFPSLVGPRAERQSRSLGNFPTSPRGAAFASSLTPIAATESAVAETTLAPINPAAANAPVTPAPVATASTATLPTAGARAANLLPAQPTASLPLTSSTPLAADTPGATPLVPAMANAAKPPLTPSEPDALQFAVEDPAASLAEFSAATRRFAPAEILSRQFAATPRQSPAPDMASAFSAPRAVSFASSSADASLAASAPVALATVRDVAVPAPFTAPAPFSFDSVVAESAPLPVLSTPTSLTATEITSAVAPALVETAALGDTTALAQREFSPAPRSEKAAATRGAKFAATTENSSSAQTSEETSVDKTFVSVLSERVARHGAELGTGVAKSDATMSATYLNRSPAAVLERAPVPAMAVAPADRTADFSTTSVLAPATTAAAQRAVDAVLTAVDRFSSGERHSVNLNFSVGGSDLNVRVELRADEVHATFRTDSPELRNALAHEWQAANGSAESGERTLRLVTPVFTGNSASSSSSSSHLSSFSGGDGSSRQRESGARQSDGESPSVAGVRSRASSSLTAAADSTPASSVVHSASSTSHRLHTHA